MKKISLSEYTDFAIEYLGGAYPHQRYGQTFLNEFYSGNGVNDPLLYYYCDNKEKAVEMIFLSYVDL